MANRARWHRWPASHQSFVPYLRSASSSTAYFGLPLRHADLRQSLEARMLSSSRAYSARTRIASLPDCAYHVCKRPLIQQARSTKRLRNASNACCKGSGPDPLDLAQDARESDGRLITGGSFTSTKLVAVSRGYQAHRRRWTLEEAWALWVESMPEFVINNPQRSILTSTLAKRKTGSRRNRGAIA